MVHLAGVAALDDQPDLGALLLADEVVVHRGGEQQAGDRRVDLVAVAVAEHDDPRPALDRLADLVADRVERPAQRQAAAGDAVQAADHRTRQVGVRPVGTVVLQVLVDVVDVDDLGQLVVVDDRERQHQLAAALRTRREQVALGPDRRADGGDDLLADRVERRVGDLREQLLEVVEQQPRALAEHGDRRVGAHRAERLAAGFGPSGR